MSLYPHSLNSNDFFLHINKNYNTPMTKNIKIKLIIIEI